MRIAIDGDRCEGHGLCYGFAPELIEPDDDGHGRVVNAEFSSELVEDARRAVANCPELAVNIRRLPEGK